VLDPIFKTRYFAVQFILITVEAAYCDHYWTERLTE
jgi:hypothetical protein